MRRYLVAALILASFCFSNKALAFDLSGKVIEYRLPNGMKWLIVKRKDAPVFSGVIMVKVGGADEIAGKTGIAHMFEHMAFKGSSKIGTRNYEKEALILAQIEQLGQERENLKSRGGF
jgi:predicted Zn-dependent peptidase